MSILIFDTKIITSKDNKKYYSSVLVLKNENDEISCFTSFDSEREDLKIMFNSSNLQDSLSLVSDPSYVGRNGHQSRFLVPLSWCNSEGEPKTTLMIFTKFY